MKKNKHSRIQVPLLLAVLLTPVLQAQTDLKSIQQNANSVVKITTTFNEDLVKHTCEHGTATGWCWKSSNLVITALHAVAGINEQSITVSNNANKTSHVKVIKVLKEADLALLQLTTDLGLKPLGVMDAEPNSDSEFYIWGFPIGVPTIQRDGIRFSISLNPTPVLTDIIPSGGLYHELDKQGYPSTSARIIRIGSTIQPGHSGSPILTKDGQVVGIADGGLRGGTSRVNWAMPAKYYVERLYISADPKPTTMSIQNSLYSHHTTVPLEASAEEQNALETAMAKSNTVAKNDSQFVSKTWTTSYQQIYNTSSGEDKKELDTLFADFADYNIDMSSTYFDVYEDFETGVSIALPQGIKPIVKDNWYSASESDGSIAYLAMAVIKPTFNEAAAYADAVVAAEFSTNSNWQISESSVYCDDVTSSCREFSRTYKYANTNSVCEMQVEINGPKILITFFTYDSAKVDTDVNYQKRYAIWALADTMTDFNEN